MISWTGTNPSRQQAVCIHLILCINPCGQNGSRSRLHSSLQLHMANNQQGISKSMSRTVASHSTDPLRHLFFEFSAEQLHNTTARVNSWSCTSWGIGQADIPSKFEVHPSAKQKSPQRNVQLNPECTIHSQHCFDLTTDAPANAPATSHSAQAGGSCNTVPSTQQLPHRLQFGGGSYRMDLSFGPKISNSQPKKSRRGAAAAEYSIKGTSNWQQLNSVPLQKSLQDEQPTTSFSNLIIRQHHVAIQKSTTQWLIMPTITRSQNTCLFSSITTKQQQKLLHQEFQHHMPATGRSDSFPTICLNTPFPSKPPQPPAASVQSFTPISPTTDPSRSKHRHNTQHCK
ncbi:hypothetical protein Nepgr_025343 [Nepenthes gracilis]|uniref:Uncharacterized protein n=1 Tax=Nepenthes gracilis TaxID=150966 RepID=A0AAD3T5R3_NEPGR|nr:hypothetical protein Nepgr_025343 [Nepenthes gracilis]